MKNYHGPGDTMQHTVSGTAIDAGDFVVVGSTVGVAMTGGAVGENITIWIGGGEFTLPCASSTYTKGALAYWDTIPGQVVKTGATTGDVLIGVFAETAAGAVTEIKVNLDAARRAAIT